MIGVPLYQPLGVRLQNNRNERAVVDLSISPDLIIRLKTSSDETLETGGSIWHAGYVLAKHLAMNSHLVKSKNVIEIGSGCGLVGLVAAALGAKYVLLTDLHVQMTVLKENIMLNRHLFGCCRVDCAPLPFGSRIEDIEKYSEYLNVDLVVGADIGYDLSLHEPIAQTIKYLQHFSGMPMNILFAEEVRWRDIFRWFLEKLTEEFGDVKLESASMNELDVDIKDIFSKCSISIVSFNCVNPESVK